jgi:hypothetical protein
MEATMTPLYILTRTSGRPEYFRALRESIKALTWPGGVTHIVHSDDPRSEDYIECDILIRGEAHGDYVGTAPYNLYQNRLIEAAPKGAWLHMIDDDDMYAAPDVFEQILDHASPEKMHVCKVRRGDGKVWPREWRRQNSFQTECFVLYGQVAKQSKWWGNKGGDHNYTRKLTRTIGIEWHDVLAVLDQEGKNNGALIDLGGFERNWDVLPGNQTVHVKMHKAAGGRQGARLYEMPFSEARVLEKHGLGRITYKGVTVVPFKADK